jgi:hypothetical protein
MFFVKAVCILFLFQQKKIAIRQAIVGGQRIVEAKRKQQKAVMANTENLSFFHMASNR